MVETEEVEEEDEEKEEEEEEEEEEKGEEDVALLGDAALHGGDLSAGRES